ncbi:MAG: Nif3-like dinuclear metal center hexameric protein [Melioribacteraceae bacterium]|nr:Nif3-like dinuclear metal center hexameric protein [Melioribacteraceae bacterium]
MHSLNNRSAFFLYMNVGELITQIEDWAPPGAAWEKDNVGLQIGSRGDKLNNILLCLELDDEVLKEAIKKKCNFIFTHHPLIFNPLKKLDFQKDNQAQLIQKLIKNNISLYSAHTNLDFTKDGVSFELAKMLKLRNIKFLELEEGNQFKISVFVPEESADKLSDALFNSGAGIIGNYENCSFRLKGEGTFKGNENANPVIGKKGKVEKVSEIRLELIVDSWNLKSAINAIKKFHPYEEPAYDIYPLKNKNMNYGAGAIGELTNELSEKEFLRHVATSLKSGRLKYCSGTGKKIKRVAVCGGSCSELTNVAINSRADTFITADIKYHVYHDAKGKILLIDAGHYETEIGSLNAVKGKIDKIILKEESIKVYKYSGSTNPVKFY